MHEVADDFSGMHAQSKRSLFQTLSQKSRIQFSHYTVYIKSQPEISCMQKFKINGLNTAYQTYLADSNSNKQHNSSTVSSSNNVSNNKNNYNNNNNYS